MAEVLNSVLTVIDSNSFFIFAEKKIILTSCLYSLKDYDGLSGLKGILCEDSLHTPWRSPKNLYPIPYMGRGFGVIS